MHGVEVCTCREEDVMVWRCVGEGVKECRGGVVV